MNTFMIIWFICSMITFLITATNFSKMSVDTFKIFFGVNITEREWKKIQMIGILICLFPTSIPLLLYYAYVYIAMK